MELKKIQLTGQITHDGVDYAPGVYEIGDGPNQVPEPVAQRWLKKIHWSVKPFSVESYVPEAGIATKAVDAVAIEAQVALQELQERERKAKETQVKAEISKKVEAKTKTEVAKK